MGILQYLTECVRADAPDVYAALAASASRLERVLSEEERVSGLRRAQRKGITSTSFGHHLVKAQCVARLRQVDIKYRKERTSQVSVLYALFHCSSLPVQVRENHRKSVPTVRLIKIVDF